MSTLRQRKEYQEQVAADRALKQQKKDEKAQIWKQTWNKLASISPENEILYDDIGLPARTQDIPRQELFELCQKFKREIEERGYVLLHAGKLEHYLSAQYAHNRELSLDTIRKSFERLLALGAFNKGELDASSVKQPEPVPETAQEPTLETLEKLDLSTREGSKAGKLLAEQLAYNGDRKVRFQEWLRSVEKNFGAVLSEEDQKTVIDFFIEHGLNFLRHEDYNITRRALVRRGDWPSTLVRQGLSPADKLLTDEEKLIALIDRSDLTNSSFDEQAALKTKLRQQIHGQNVLRN